MLPILPVWRRFPQLRGRSDGECRAITAAACVRFGTLALPAIYAGGLVGLAVVLGLAIRDERGRDWQLVHDFEPAGLTVLFAWLVLPAALAVATAILVRSWQAARALGHLFKASNCPRCGYTLEGLRLVEPPGVDPNPAERRIRCPECGKQWTLMQLGLSAIDLLPWELRVPRGDVGRMRRSG